MSALNKTILREIKGTFGRFISILLLIAVGVFAYVGISVTGSNMRYTGIQYSNDLNLADIFIQSTYGLNEDDQKALATIPELTYIEYGYSTDVTIAKAGQAKTNPENQLSIKIESLPQTLSVYEVVDGRLPENKNEIVFDNKVNNMEKLAIGDTIEFIKTNDDDNSVDNFTQTTYTIVGFVNSAEYLLSTERGQSLSGKGELYAYAAVLPEVFDMEVYTIARAKADIANESDTEKQTYDDNITTRILNIKSTIDEKELAEKRLDKIKTEIEETLTDAEQKIADGKKELTDAEKTLTDSETELADAKNEYYSGKDEFETQIAEQTTLLTSSEQALNNAKVELDQAELQLQTAKEELDAAEQGLIAGETALEQAMSEWQTNYDLFLEQKTQYETAEETYAQAKADWEAEIISWEIAQADLDDRIAISGLTPALQAEQDALDAQKQILDQTQIELASTRTYLDGVKTTLDNAEIELNAAKTILDANQVELNSGREQYEAGLVEYNTGKQQFDENYQVYLQAKADIENGWQLLNTAQTDGEITLADAWAQISEGEQKLQEGWQEFNEKKPEAEQEIAEAEQEITDARTELADLKAPTYMVKSRNDLLGYDMFFDNGARLDVLAYIFPTFLFFIAALVTLTTMTRMVEEQRTQIGTLKALGYTKKDILRKYIIYGAISGGIGTIIGTILGLEILPRLIYSAYSSGFLFTDVQTKFYPVYVAIGIIIAIICTIVPAVASVNTSLKEKATELMRPKAPKVGKRILLERFSFIWSKMSFNYKVTARNLFRYKQRMFMTIIGIAGCVALLIMGIGIRDSLGKTITVQLDEIYTYDIEARFNSEADATDLTNYANAIATNPNIESDLKVVLDTVEISRVGEANDEISVVVPEKPNQLNDYIYLMDTKDAPIIADNTGIVLSQKMAESYNVVAGDEITLVKDEFEYTAKVGAVNQWYIGHQMVIAPDYYQTLFGEQPPYNAYLINVNNSEQIPKILNALNDQKANLLTMSLGSTTEVYEENMNGLNLVMVVLLGLATLLAVIVLYNLTNINISERIRELSTIKVLGFYPKEVTLYIYRETLILTVLGIIVGWFLGTALEQFVIIQIPPKEVLFHRDIYWTNYAISSAITYAIALVIMFIMHRKIKNVDMIEALKSVE